MIVQNNLKVRIKKKRNGATELNMRLCDGEIIGITSFPLQKFTRTASHVGKTTRQLGDNFVTRVADLTS